MVQKQSIPVGYKQSDAGVIPNDWEAVSLSKMINFKNGKAHENDIEKYGKYVLINSKFVSSNGQIFKKTNKRIQPIDSGEIAMVMSDIPNGKAIAKCFLVDKNDTYTLNQRICSIRPTSDDPRYLKLQINRNPYYLSFDDGVKQTNLRKEDVLGLIVRMPPDITEQKNIAQAIFNIDSLIIRFTQLIQKKINVKHGSMQELLTGKRRLPGFSGKWQSYLLPKVAWFQEGPGVRNTQFTRRGVKLLNGTNIFRGKIDLDKTDRFISESEAFGAYHHFLADNGDIVIASSGITVEKFDDKIAFVEKKHLPLCMNTSTIRFKVGGNMIPNFLYYFLMSSEFKQQIGEQATGSAQLNFGPAHLKKVELTVPDTDEQTAIAQVLSDMDAEIESLEKQKSKYIDLKQGMMQQLLTGKIRLI